MLPRAALLRHRSHRHAPFRLQKRPSPSPGLPLTDQARFPSATEALALAPFQKLAFGFPIPLDAIPKLKFRGAASVAQSLREHRESAFLSRRLTGIACDMPLTASRDDLQRRPPDLSAVDAFAEAQGFGRTLGNRARKLVAS